LTGSIAVNHPNTPDDEAGEAAFVRLLTSHQLDITLYVHSLVPDQNEAAEIIQSTNTILWEKRSQFVMSTNFRAWAFQIARYELLEWRAKRRRNSVCFSDAMIDELALQAPSHAIADTGLLDELRRCVAQLTVQDHELLTKRYTSGKTCESIAKSIGRPIRWVYKALGRIRSELRNCVAQHANARRDP
jgi:RNA polymerase sigma-70 factor, ECF subfamily